MFRLAVAFSSINLVSSADDLCAEWTEVDTGNKCVPGQQCCEVAKNGASEEDKYYGVCDPNAAQGVASFITQEGYNFASNGEYLKRFRLGTGNCPLVDGGGTITLAIDTVGDYDLGEENEDFPGWNKISYRPTRFKVAVAKTNKAIYYTPEMNGRCMDPLNFLNDGPIGCACNGTWEIGSYDADNGNYTGSRRIAKSDCPAGTCNDTFWFAEDIEYGNALLTNVTEERTVNGTLMNVTFKNLKLSSTSTNMTLGYSYNDVKYEFVQSGDCAATADPDDTTPAPVTTTNAKLSPSSALRASLTLALGAAFVGCLM